MKTQLLALGVTPAILLAASLQARPPHMPPPPPAEDVVVDMFATFDVDESETLSEDELVAAFIGTRAKHMSERAEAGLCPNPDQAGAGQGPRGPGRGMGKGPGPMVPQEFVPGLIEQFDTDGDSALNTEEALAAITFLHESRGPGRFAPPPPEDSIDESDTLE